MIPSSVEAFAFAAVLVTLVVLNHIAPRRFLALSGFLIPLITPGLTVGVNLFWFNIIGFVSLALLPLTKQAPGLKATRGTGLVLLAAWAIAVTLVWMTLEYTILERYRLAAKLGLGPAQTVYRMPVQLISFLFQLLTFYIVPSRARDAADVAAAERGFFWGCLTSLAVGVALSLVTGVGMLGDRERGVISILGVRVPRIGGLSGEPKNLAAFLTVAFAFLLSRYLYLRTTPRFLRTYLVIVVAGVFVTFSTSGWVGFVAAVAVAIALGTQRLRQVRGKTELLVVAFGLLLAAQLPFVTTSVTDRIYVRLFDPDKQEIDESKDAIIRDLYEDNPELVPFGFGLGGADLEATPYVLTRAAYAKQLQYIRTPTAAVTGVRLFGDIGIIGLCIFTYVVVRWMRELRSVGLPHLSAGVVAGYAGSLLVSFNAVGAYLFLCGAALATSRMLRRRQARSTPLARSAA